MFAAVAFEVREVEAVVDAAVDLNVREAWACKEGEQQHGAALCDDSA